MCGAFILLLAGQLTLLDRAGGPGDFASDSGLRGTLSAPSLVAIFRRRGRWLALARCFGKRFDPLMDFGRNPCDAVFAKPHATRKCAIFFFSVYLRPGIGNPEVFEVCIRIEKALGARLRDVN